MKQLRKSIYGICLKLTGFYELGAFGEDENSEISGKGQSIKVDPDYERMELLVDQAENMDDIEFARGVVTEKVLIAKLDLKENQIKKK